MQNLIEPIQSYLNAIHATIPLELLDCPDIQAAEIELEKAIERANEN